MLVTKLQSQNFSHKSLVTKFQSQNFSSKISRTKFQSQHFSHKILVTKFQSQNCSHQLTFSQSPTTDRGAAKNYRVPELALIICMRICNSANFYKFCSCYKLTLRKFSFSHNFFVFCKQKVFSVCYYCHYCHYLLSLNSSKGLPTDQQTDRQTTGWSKKSKHLDVLSI